VIHENPAGIHSPVASSISIFPNPVAKSGETFLFFADDSFTGSALTVFDSNGKIVRATMVEDRKQSLGVKNFEPGFYFVSVVNDKTNAVFKLLILP